jgi:hypothetical protein
MLLLGGVFTAWSSVYAALSTLSSGSSFGGGINEVSNRIMSVPDYFHIRQLGELLNQNTWTSLTPTYSAS